MGVSENKQNINLALVQATSTGIYWKGLFEKKHVIEEGSTYYCVLSAPEIATAEIAEGKVVNWFYGNQGKSVYVDFIYKGGVTLV